MTEFEQKIIEYERQQVYLCSYGPRGVSFLSSGPPPITRTNPLLYYCSVCKIESKTNDVIYLGKDTAHKKGCKNLLMSMLGM